MTRPFPSRNKDVRDVAYLLSECDSVISALKRSNTKGDQSAFGMWLGPFRPECCAKHDESIFGIWLGSFRHVSERYLEGYTKLSKPSRYAAISLWPNTYVNRNGWLWAVPLPTHWVDKIGVVSVWYFPFPNILAMWSDLNHDSHYLSLSLWSNYLCVRVCVWS